MTKEEFENFEVGKTFELGYRKFTVMEVEDGCDDCFFDEICEQIWEYCRKMARNNFIPECYSENRKDEKNVIFVEVEE